MLEDELHLITASNTFTFYINNEIKDRNLNFEKMFEISKFIWLMSNKDEIIVKQFADFFNCYKLRNISRSTKILFNVTQYLCFGETCVLYSEVLLEFKLLLPTVYILENSLL
jgi:hypothetical protein